MGLLTWLGISTTAPVEIMRASVAVPPPRSSFGVSLDTAVTLPTVFRAIGLLATVCGQLRIDELRGGEKVPSLIVDKPDPWTSQRKFIKRTVTNLAGTGTAAWEILRGPAGQVAGIRVLNPNGLTYTSDLKRRRRVWTYADEWGSREIADVDLKLLRLLELAGRVKGLGPIEACRLSLSGALDLREFASTWFSPNDGGGSAGVPTGVLSTPDRLDPAAAKQYRTTWEASQSTRGIAVLGNGLKYEPIVISPEDAQFLQSQQFAVTDVARMFGIPATYLLAEVNGSSMTYQNLEQVDLAFVRTTLMGYLGEIEDALTDILPAGRLARFNLADYLRPDAKTRAEINSTYLDKGVVSADEVRRSEGLSGPAPTVPAAQEIPA